MKKLGGINISDTLSRARAALAEDKSISASTKAIFEVLIMIIELLAARFGLNSSNSSQPPSSDLNRDKKPKGSSKKKPGGQKGHAGKKLEKFSKPDEVKYIPVDRTQLPDGKYEVAGYESRQVVEIIIKRHVTEYRAEVLKNLSDGKKHTAQFPDFLTQPVQYGRDLKAHSVYMSQYQLLPYLRIEDYFREQLGIPISAGSIFNFNKEAYRLLEKFDTICKQKLISSEIIQSDETGINVGGKRIWLHSASNNLWAYFHPHIKRGTEAMDEIGILPEFKGVLCHDHWKSYYKYQQCLHALCNAHHLRELEDAIENYKQNWAKDMQDLLKKISHDINKAGGALPKTEADIYRLGYRKILQAAEIECPPPPIVRGKRGKPKKSKPRNLLERLRNFEDDILRCMDIGYVPFTNNQAENDIRMTKVQQKISGCFRSIEGAKIFCRVRSYIKTCQKQNLDPAQALKILFAGKLPDFCSK